MVRFTVPDNIGIFIERQAKKFGKRPDDLVAEILERFRSQQRQLREHPALRVSQRVPAIKCKTCGAKLQVAPASVAERLSGSEDSVSLPCPRGHRNEYTRGEIEKT